jgi:hypothetical protein
MNATWNELQAVLQHKDRTWATFVRRQRVIGAALDPRTGGDGGLIHNWGTEEAREAMARGWKRWHAYDDASRARSRELMKRYAVETRPVTPPKRDRYTVRHALAAQGRR